MMESSKVRGKGKSKEKLQGPGNSSDRKKARFR